MLLSYADVELGVAVYHSIHPQHPILQNKKIKNSFSNGNERHPEVTLTSNHALSFSAPALIREAAAATLFFELERETYQTYGPKGF